MTLPTYLFKTRAGFTQPGICKDCSVQGEMKRYQFANGVWHVFFYCPHCERKVSGFIAREELQRNEIDLMTLPIYDKTAVTAEREERIPACPGCGAHPDIAKEGEGKRQRLVWFCRTCAQIAGDLAERDIVIHSRRLKYIESTEVYKYRAMPYEEYLQTSHWQRLRFCMRWLTRNRCQLCGETDNLQVHHNTYKNLGCERPEDLIVLCARCHSLHHKNLAKETETL